MSLSTSTHPFFDFVRKSSGSPCPPDPLEEHAGRSLRTSYLFRSPKTSSRRFRNVDSIKTEFPNLESRLSET